MLTERTLCLLETDSQDVSEYFKYFSYCFDGPPELQQKTGRGDILSSCTIYLIVPLSVFSASSAFFFVGNASALYSPQKLLMWHKWILDKFCIQVQLYCVLIHSKAR